jgi:hypothetical protein
MWSHGCALLTKTKVLETAKPASSVAEQIRVAGVAGTMQSPEAPQERRGVSRRTECGHEPCAESVPIVPAQIHLSIRTAANPARVVRRLRLKAIPLPQYWPGELRRVGGAAIFPRVVSRRSFGCGRAGGDSQALWVATPYPRLRCLVIPRPPTREHDHRRVAASPSRVRRAVRAER